MLNLGLQMEELIFELADTHLFFNDLEVHTMQITTGHCRNFRNISFISTILTVNKSPSLQDKTFTFFPLLGM